MLGARLLSVVEGCLDPDPARRWTLPRVADALTLLQQEVEALPASDSGRYVATAAVVADLPPEPSDRDRIWALPDKVPSGRVIAARSIAAADGSGHTMADEAGLYGARTLGVGAFCTVSTYCYRGGPVAVKELNASMGTDSMGALQSSRVGCDFSSVFFLSWVSMTGLP